VFYLHVALWVWAELEMRNVPADNRCVLCGQCRQDVPLAQRLSRSWLVVSVSARHHTTALVRLTFSLDPIRVEVNFTMPLIGRKGERMARGFGVGVGLEFL
jgi:hypothetical protein